MERNKRHRRHKERLLRLNDLKPKGHEIEVSKNCIVIYEFNFFMF